MTECKLIKEGSGKLRTEFTVEFDLDDQKTARKILSELRDEWTWETQLKEIIENDG